MTSKIRFCILLISTWCLFSYGNTQVVLSNFNSTGDFTSHYKVASGASGTQSSGVVSIATGTSAFWYTTNPSSTGTTQPYGFPSDSLFSYNSQSMKVSMDFLGSSATTGKLTIPSIGFFSPSFTGTNSGIMAVFTSNNDSASSPDSLSLRYVTNPTGTFGTTIVSSSPSNAVLNWGTGNTQWLRLELIINPVSTTSASFTANLYSIPSSESTSATSVASLSSTAITFGTGSSNVDFSSGASFAVVTRNYIDSGASLGIDNIMVTSVPESSSYLFLFGFSLMFICKRCLFHKKVRIQNG